MRTNGCSRHRGRESGMRRGEPEDEEVTTWPELITMCWLCWCCLLTPVRRFSSRREIRTHTTAPKEYLCVRRSASVFGLTDSGIHAIHMLLLLFLFFSIRFCFWLLARRCMRVCVRAFEQRLSTRAAEFDHIYKRIDRRQLLKQSQSFARTFKTLHSPLQFQN